MKRLCASVLTSAIVLTSQMSWAADPNLAALEQAARKEGEVNSVGMPDSWANWKDTWQDLQSKYGLKHADTDMSSAQEIAKFDAEKGNATADIGDVGAAFGPSRCKKGSPKLISRRPGSRCLTGRKTRMAIGRWPIPAPSPSSLTNSR